MTLSILLTLSTKKCSRPSNLLLLWFLNMIWERNGNYMLFYWKFSDSLRCLVSTLKISKIFTKKYLYWNLFSNIVGFRLGTFWNRSSDISVLLWILRSFSVHMSAAAFEFMQFGYNTEKLSERDWLDRYISSAWKIFNLSFQFGKSSELLKHA